MGILISDMEGVLIDGEFLPILAEHQGKAKEVQEITEKGIKGEISWKEGLKKRIELLKGASYEDAKKISENMSYMKGAHELCKGLKEKGYTLIGVTGGFKLFAERAKEELGLDYVFSNELQFEDGELKGLKNIRVTEDKIEGLDDLIKENGFSEEDTTTLADGANNLKLFSYANRTVAFNAQPIIKENADLVVESRNLEDVLELLPQNE